MGKHNALSEKEEEEKSLFRANAVNVGVVHGVTVSRWTVAWRLSSPTRITEHSPYPVTASSFPTSRLSVRQIHLRAPVCPSYTLENASLSVMSTFVQGHMRVPCHVPIYS